MQLGPLILSNLSLEYGLGESFLERLIGRFPYMRDMQGFPTTCGYDPRLITKLVYNYRSLPIILKLSSLMFYNDDLKPTVRNNCLMYCHFLMKKCDIVVLNFCIFLIYSFTKLLYFK